jgi:hypothetical protein
MVAFAGVTVTEVADAEVTVRDAVPEIVPEVAVMVELPAATAWASPLVGETLLTVTTAAFEEVQLAALVRFCTLPSL